MLLLRGSSAPRRALTSPHPHDAAERPGDSNAPGAPDAARRRCGRDGLGLESSEFLQFFSDLGLGMLFFEKSSQLAVRWIVVLVFALALLAAELGALSSSLSSVAKMALFFGLFLVVRGVPALLL